MRLFATISEHVMGEGFALSAHLSALFSFYQLLWHANDKTLRCLAIKNTERNGLPSLHDLLPGLFWNFCLSKISYPTGLSAPTYPYSPDFALCNLLLFLKLKLPFKIRVLQTVDETKVNATRHLMMIPKEELQTEK